MARALLLLALLLRAGAEEPPWPGWDRAGLTARDHVVMELWRRAGESDGRVVLRNRTDQEVRVEFRVAASLMDVRTYAAQLGAQGRAGLDEPIPVPIGGQLQPEMAVVRVDRVPITESSAYVRWDEDAREGVSARVYGRADGGDRAWLVLGNNREQGVAVRVRIAGLGGGDLVIERRVAAKSVLGSLGELPLTYAPDPGPYAPPVRVTVEAVTAQ